MYKLVLTALMVGSTFSVSSFAATVSKLKMTMLCVTFNAYQPMDTNDLIEAISGGGRPDEATAQKLKSLTRVLNDKLVEMNVHSANASANIWLNQCGPKAITVELPEARRDEFLSIVEDLGGTYRLHDNGGNWVRPYSDEAIVQVLAEGNAFLIRTARSLLNARTNEEVSKIVQASQLELQAWDKLEIQGIGRTIQKGVIALNEGMYISRELREIHSAAQSLQKIDTTITVEEFLKAAKPAPPAWGLNFEQLERLKVEMKDSTLPVDNVLSEQQEAVIYHASLTESQKQLEARIKFVEKALWISTVYLNESDIFTTESYELGALLFLKSVAKLEGLRGKDGRSLIAEFEIVDVLNRYLSLFSHTPQRYAAYGAKLRLGQNAVRSFKKILSYDGLDPFIRLLLTAVLSSAGPERIEPGPEHMAAYETMWRNMPMVKVESYQSLVPHKHYGALFNAVTGPVSKEVINGINEIENWIGHEGVHIKARLDHLGVPLDVARQRYAEARQRFLESRVEGVCDSLLGEFLDRTRQKPSKKN